MTMLDRMRRHKGWLKWSLALVVLTFIVFYIPAFLQNPTAAGASPGAVIAQVEGRDVTAGEFRRRYQNQIQAYQGAYGGKVSAQLLRQLGVERQVLQQMIDEQAAIAEAERQGIRVSDEELAQQIFSIPAFQEKGRFVGERRYEQVLRSQRPPITKGDFEESLRRSLLVDKLRGALTAWMSVSDADIEREYRHRNEKVKLQLVALTANTFRDKVSVSDADVQTYFDAHKENYRIGERRKIKFVLIDMDQARAKATVPESEVRRQYNETVEQYQTPEQIRASHILISTEGKDEATARKEAEDLLAKVKAGGDFAALAKAHSDDPASKANGGDLDYFGRGRMVPEFEKVAFSMEPGQVSDLVKTQFGFHIIKLVDKKPGTTRALDEVRAQITEQLKFRHAQEAVEAQARALEGKIKRPADLEPAAKAAGYTVQESGFFTREEPIPGIGGAPAVAQAAFQLKDGEVSQAVNSARGPVIVTVTGKKDPYVPSLDEVKDKVKNDVIQERAKELSRQRANEIAATLRSAKDFDAAAKAQGLAPKSTELIARESAIPDVGVSAEIDKVAFSLPVGGVSEPIAAGTGTVILRVADRDDVTPEEFRQGRDAFREQLLSERRGQFFAAYMNKVKQKMSIKVNNDVLRQVVGT